MKKATNHEIGKRLAEIRRSNNYTQEQLADALDLTPKHISHCESVTSSVSLKSLIRFCELFSCSMDYIIWGKSTDEKLDQLNETALSVLRCGSDQDVDLLNCYLDIYAELLNSDFKQKNEVWDLCPHLSDCRQSCSGIYIPEQLCLQSETTR